MQSHWTGYAIPVILALLLYMPLFGHLNNLPIRQFDESRLTINAYEMLENGNLLVTHFAGAPDLWNTKPPLLIWIQAIWMKLIGTNELAVRLPSALAALLTCFVLYRFAVRHLKNQGLGALMVMILVTTDGYVEVHGTRTGDYDALLTLFTTLGGLSFFLYVQHQKTRDLYWCFVWLILATLTKGVAALLFIPAMGLFALWSGRLGHLLASRHFYLALSGWVMLVGGYYGLRELEAPGYLQAVYHNELGGRYLDVIEHHQHGFWYYARDILQAGFFPWWIFLLVGAGIGLRRGGDPFQRRCIVYALMMTAIFFLVISSAGTKLEWYEIPIYPWMTVVAALGVGGLVTWISGKCRQGWARTSVTAGLVVLIFSIPYARIWDKTHTPDEQEWDGDMYDISYFLRDAIKGEYDLDGYKLVHPGYHPQVDFYVRVLLDQGTEIQFQDYRALGPGDTVIVSQRDMLDSIHVHFHVQELYRINSVHVNAILEPMPPQ